MVRILSATVTLLAWLASAEACSTYLQCKYSTGAHCCVLDGTRGASACPARCDGGAAWPAECISAPVGKHRTKCD
ncbi:hypothetical protein Cob_v001399 [Colletotrichum orbiculare MAFF 240422]|uniref:Uncharacterized protein n=1 Tax=Colletotrichum orbiculare (strain 104-T / ATCC 96160 / CBS 514.97 / LARS 414 / MAFF 240422) TaxID=1213857 RepID=A0A484G7Z5_COLOR|nr:hypothetical protein Cob_v001399 [Colletotrichum orbiculare MAFF 240422]